METPNQDNTQADGYPPVYRSMMTVGLLGSVYGKHEDAATVSTAIEMTLHDPTQFRINRALAQGLGGDPKFAVEALGKHLEQHPDDDATKVVMAVSMMLGGDPGWKPIIDNVLASSADQTAREAAVNVIGYLKSLG